MSLGIALAIGCLVLASCGDDSKSASSCQPAAPSAKPKVIKAGGTVIVSSAGLRCRPRFSGTQRYTLRLYPARGAHGGPDRSRALTVATLQVGSSGAFSTAIHVPSSFAPGGAYVEVSAPQLDRRLACPPNALCAAYATSFEVIKRS